MKLRDELTAKEFERAGLLTLGLSLKDIAGVVGMSQFGIRNAFRKMYEKTGTSDKLELAVRYAWEEFRGNKPG